MPVGNRELTLPIFPLASVVLFPKTRVPLHIFEDRYRQMIREALEGERRIGMVAVKSEGSEETATDPPLYEVGCLGVLTHARALPDGRYDIVLAGRHRFRILHEEPRTGERLYRVARAELLDDLLEPSQAERVTALRARVTERFGELARRLAPDTLEASELSFFEDADDVVFVNSLSQMLDLPTPEKQALLASPSVPARYERLLGALEFRLAALAAGASVDSGRVH